MRILIALLIGTLVSSTLWAASVTQVKNKRLIIQLEGESISSGSEIYITNSAGKRIGLALVSQVKGNRALADIVKGRANVGDKAVVKGASAGANSGSRRTARKGGNKMGLLVGYAMNSMSLTVQSSQNSTIKETVSLSDSSFNAKAFYDYYLSPTLVIRGATGLETFTAKGTTNVAICNNGTSLTCSVAFNYLAFEGSAQYNLSTGPSRFFVGLGYSFLMAMSKSNNIPNLSSDSSTDQMILASIGSDISMGSSFIPIVVEYGIFPGSSNVSASSIFLRTGYGF